MEGNGKAKPCAMDCQTKLSIEYYKPFADSFRIITKKIVKEQNI